MAYFEDLLHFLPILFGTLLICGIKISIKSIADIRNFSIFTVAKYETAWFMGIKMLLSLKQEQ